MSDPINNHSDSPKAPKGLFGLIVRMYQNDILRYVFWGGCTTLVNLVVFYILRHLNVELNIANFLSIIAALLFAYVVNAKFVFHDHCETLKQKLASFVRFISARLVTMVVEMLGVWVFAQVLHWNDMVGKIVTQFVVIVLNYIFSKFFVFKHRGGNEL